MHLLALVLGLVLLTASSAAAAVTITCPGEVMVNTLGKNLPAGLTTWEFDRRAVFHSTGVLPSGSPTFVFCAYKVVQPNEAPPRNPDFHLRQDFPANTTCAQRGADSWECLTAIERQLRQSVPLPQPHPDLPKAPGPR